jgi:hypothetical protein
MHRALRLVFCKASVQPPNACISPELVAKLWQSMDISTRTKTCIYGCLVLSVLLHGAESRPITPSQLQLLEDFHHRCLRSILGVCRSDRISTEELLRRTHLCNIGTTIHCLWLQWLGHVMQMPGERVAPQVLFGQVRGTRPVGSPPVSLRGLMRNDVLRHVCMFHISWHVQSYYVSQGGTPGVGL